MKVYAGKKNLEFGNLNIYLKENTYLYLFPLITLVFIHAAISIYSLRLTKIALLVAVTGFLHITERSGILLQEKRILLRVLFGVFLSVLSLALFFIDTLVLINFIGGSKNNTVYSHFIYLVLILLISSQDKAVEGLLSCLLNEVAKKDPESNERELNLETLWKKLSK